MRHGTTDHLQKDSDRHKLEDCNSQRNLSPQGREQVTRTGQAIRSLGISVGDVTSSRYCRCKDTARLAFGKIRFEPDLRFSINKNEQESRHLGERLYTMMLDVDPSQKTNTVFVGHTSNLRDGLGVWPKPEGVIAVFRKEQGRLVYKGMIGPNEWPAR